MHKVFKIRCAEIITGYKRKKVKCRTQEICMWPVKVKKGLKRSDCQTNFIDNILTLKITKNALCDSSVYTLFSMRKNNQKREL